MSHQPYCSPGLGVIFLSSNKNYNYHLTTIKWQTSLPNISIPLENFVPLIIHFGSHAAVMYACMYVRTYVPCASLFLPYRVLNSKIVHLQLHFM